MKRRNFLGFMGGAAVAGPGMAKEIAAKTVSDLSLGKAGMLVDGAGYGMPSSAPAGIGQPTFISNIARGASMLQKLGGLTASQRSQYKRRMQVYAIDPDIAGYRSISMQAKLDWQRERQLDNQISERKSLWQRLAEGGSDYEDSPL